MLQRKRVKSTSILTRVPNQVETLWGISVCLFQMWYDQSE